MARKPGGTKPQPPKRGDPSKSLPVSTANLPPPEVLQNLPENVRLSIVEAAAFSGPLPPPSMYGEYEGVFKGSAERILKMAEKEQDHRIAWESRALDESARETNRGQNYGLVIAVFCISGAVYLAMNEHLWPAIVLAGTTALGLAARFLPSRQKAE